MEKQKQAGTLTHLYIPGFVTNTDYMNLTNQDSCFLTKKTA